MPSADTTTTTTLATNHRRLGFNRTADDLNDLIAQAARKRSSATVLLEHIVAAELEDKQRRSVESRLTRARLGRFKPFADWDWQWPTALDRPTLERILTLDFLARGENVILVGAQGLGKTMLAKNIAHQAILAGHTALFTTAADLLLDLNGQETARALERRLRHYTRPALLVVDEVGYLAYDARAADLLFQLVSRRYEHRSLLITTNLPFKRWDTVFPNASCAVALIDRLTHHVEILLLEGRSYRRREAEISQQERNPNDRTVTTRRNHRDPHVVNETGRYLCRNDQFLALGNIDGRDPAGPVSPRAAGTRPARTSTTPSGSPVSVTAPTCCRGTVPARPPTPAARARAATPRAPPSPRAARPTSCASAAPAPPAPPAVRPRSAHGNPAAGRTRSSAGYPPPASRPLTPRQQHEPGQPHRDDFPRYLPARGEAGDEGVIRAFEVSVHHHPSLSGRDRSLQGWWARLADADPHIARPAARLTLHHFEHFLWNCTRFSACDAEVGERLAVNR